jgi:putative endonuclease
MVAACGRATFTFSLTGVRDAVHRRDFGLSARLEQHRSGIASAFTKKYRVTRLVYCEAHDWMTSAIQRESSLKRWKREWKIDLIESVNPKWENLEKTLI